MNIKSLTIRNRLLLLTLGLIIPFVVLGFFNLWNFWQTSRTNLDESLHQQAKLAAKAFEQNIIAQRQPLFMLSSLLQKEEDNFTIQDYLDSAVKTRSEWLDLQVLDRNGKSIFSQKVKQQDQQDDSVQKAKEAADRENDFIISTEFSFEKNKKILSMSMPTAQENYIVAQIDGISIKKILENLEMPKENLIIVFDKKNRLFYQNRDLPEDISFEKENVPLFSTLQKKVEGVVEIENGFDGISRVYGVSSVESVNAFVAIGIPTAKFYEPTRQHFIRQALISLLLAALAIAAAILITRSITKPMKDLTETVRSFGAGKTDVRMKNLSDGIVGELGSTFNKMAEKIVEREEKLKELDRLKSDFVNSVSHELRTPLTTIKTLTYVLRNDKLPLSERTEYLEKITEECNRQIEFVQTLLNLSRIESGAYKIRLTPTDVTESIKKCIENHKQTAETRNLKLNFDPPSKNLPLAETDDRALSIIISSLIENALKYTPAGGEINLSATEQTENIVITISDNGSGIAESDIPHIFEKFYRGKPLENIELVLSAEEENQPSKEVFGIGLGLYLVNNVAKELNTEILVESPNKQTLQGTKFTLLLPKESR
ncbi:MAG: ATP-binding protein [Aridibacter sp.]